MSFSINTNVASLQAQNYLAINQTFQDKTINEVTSGLRIVNSGDDAAGLAIANGYRSDEAVLTQGIQNANSGDSDAADHGRRNEQHFAASGPGPHSGHAIGVWNVHRQPNRSERRISKRAG